MSSMTTTVERWGKSLAVRLPRRAASATGMTEGCEVELTLKPGALVIRPTRRKRPALSRLLKRITPTNRHRAVPTGGALGSEAS